MLFTIAVLTKKKSYFSRNQKILNKFKDKITLLKINFTYFLYFLI